MKKEIDKLFYRVEQLERDVKSLQECNHTAQKAIHELELSLKINNPELKCSIHFPHWCSCKIQPQPEIQTLKVPE